MSSTPPLPPSSAGNSSPHNAVEPVTGNILPGPGEVLAARVHPGTAEVAMATIDDARAAELTELCFHTVRRAVFRAYADPRSPLDELVVNAFALTLPGIPAECTDAQAEERLLDKAMDLAEKDLADLDGRALQWISLVDVYGYGYGTELLKEFRAVDELPMSLKAVVHLRVVYGLTSEDAGRLLGRSAGGVRKLFMQAKDLLKSAGVWVEELAQFFRDEFERND
ncbi:hypothetical protein ACPCSC_05810 [Streptomyces lavendulocolor]|uniref:hypothetical protein n=1 Tax=Streptomyces lavendulocolor TaxID=67316 RepID=UPI003C2B32F6